MPTLAVYQHGMTAGTPGPGSPCPPKRGDCLGWSAASARSNTRFLYSVEASGLTGHGFALSCTVRDCPPSHAEWAAARNAFVRRLRRLGLVRMHWLTEWQRRGVPHLHAAAWLPDDVEDARQFLGPIVRHWVDVCGAFGAAPRGQHVAPLTSEVGWFKYLSKHAARGVGHYQRSHAGIPAAWQKTGRMWGALGDWPRREAMRFDVGPDAFWEFRRLVRGWRLANARAAGDARRVRSARRMLQSADRAVCELRGVSEWISEPLALSMLAFLAGQGWDVRQVS